MEKDDNSTKYIIAFIILAAMVVAMIYLSNTSNNSGIVEAGDEVYVNYVGKYLSGEIFDTSFEDVAIEADIYQQDRPYQPLKLLVGAGRVIEGFDDGVLGMKLGEKKTLTIPPEKAYGPTDFSKIQVIPLIDEIPLVQDIPVPETIELELLQFNQTFGTGYVVGDSVQFPDTTINFTIVNMSETVNIIRDLDVGNTFNLGEQSPWDETVMAMNETHLTVKHSVEVDDVLQFPGPPWNSTVINVDETNITVQHNPIPDATVETYSGSVKIHFNETAITLDNNHFLAGKTLVFDIEIVDIIKPDNIAVPAIEP
ncbi:MAG TPA: FKBP-type peptidyl-prolyl cis-trans isomerase [Candidatus Nanoarchaeia archaeon]|nr:FKBP-type peptidyl-prolyl cis-trans isomerase [Candidatus Nanoarchaeia archaeon]